jgi:hypothetical protein
MSPKNGRDGPAPEVPMGGRTFAEDVKQLGRGAGDVPHGEAILASEAAAALLGASINYPLRAARSPGSR